MGQARAVSFAQNSLIVLLASAMGVHCLGQTGLAQSNLHKQSDAKSSHRAPDMTPVEPETVGFSSARLENLHKLIQDEID